ncbi:hypothetical protein HK104_006840, partial [Borealophlyctis nickersoniae]
MVHQNDITETQAIDIAHDILFANANRIYKLGWTNGADVEEVKNGVQGLEVVRELEKKGVKFVRVTWTDCANITRTKLVPLKHFSSVPKKGVSVSSAVLSLPYFADHVLVSIDTVTVARDLQLVPDMTTLVQLPYHPKHAAVMGEFFGEDGEAHPVCPKGFLRKMLKELKDTHNLTLKLGFELEFQLLENPASPGSSSCATKPVDSTHYCDWSALRPRIAKVLDEIVDALEAQGVDVEFVHPESAGGQFEVVLRFCDAMEAVDKVVIAKQTIYNIPTLHDLKATFLPKPDMSEAGNSLHAHLSLWRDGQSIYTLDSSPTLPTGPIGPITRHFMAGILHHLPALLSFTVPSVNSFKRLQPGCWAGAYQCWGFANKEAPLRAQKDNFEYKAMDGLANPYLALGALIAAGLNGLDSQMDLPDPVNVDPERLDAKTRTRLNIERLPEDFQTALYHLEDDEELQARIGKE